MNNKKIGIEVEYLLLNEKKETVMPPSYLNRDGYPVLGEIRAEPGKTVSETISNFWKAYYETLELIPKDYTILFTNRTKVSLELHKEALKQVTEAKGKHIGMIKNIYGEDIDSKSDMIIKDGTIDGVFVSCGLHLHFSNEEKRIEEYNEYEYELVTLPIQIAEVSGKASALKELIKPEICLYRKKYNKEAKKEVSVAVSKLNRPTIEYIVKGLDDNILGEFIPSEKECTKFRHKGYWESKEYGFEYRSLPANDKTLSLESLFKIVSYAFEILDECN